MYYYLFFCLTLNSLSHLIYVTIRSQTVVYYKNSQTVTAKRIDVYVESLDGLAVGE